MPRDAPVITATFCPALIGDLRYWQHRMTGDEFSSRAASFKRSVTAETRFLSDARVPHFACGKTSLLHECGAWPALDNAHNDVCFLQANRGRAGGGACPAGVTASGCFHCNTFQAR
jgi:hypothetical protein